MSKKIQTFFHVTAIFLLITPLDTQTQQIRICDSKIYCQGPLLDTIQRAEIFKNPKTFVDLSLKYPPNIVYDKFQTFMQTNGGTPSTKQISGFVEDNFNGPNVLDTDKCRPKDWIPNPQFLNNSKNHTVRKWLTELHSLWIDLCRTFKTDLYRRPKMYSAILVENPFIVPGGKLNEYYYWDSYWIILGLLVSEMELTTRKILENFIYLIDTEHYVPNGGRIYYLGRSQPPLLIPMAQKYYEYTKDFAFLEKYTKRLEDEYKYWMSHHIKSLPESGGQLAVYGHEILANARPEVYLDDVWMVKNGSGNGEVYKEIRAAAESGWVSSSRWFVGGDNRLKASEVAPVDLNAILCWNTKILSEFYKILGQREKSEEYLGHYEVWVRKIERYFYDEYNGIWFDYHLRSGLNKEFYPSNFAPLWTGCYPPEKREMLARRAVKYLKKTKAASYPGGIPASLYKTGEQWDYPNCWPPLQHMVIVGLLETQEPEAKKTALKLARKWIRSNFVSYNLTKSLFNKYDAMKPEKRKYRSETGYGWTYGVILDLINRFEEDLFDFDGKEFDDYSSVDYSDIGKAGILHYNDLKKKTEHKEEEDVSRASNVQLSLNLLAILVANRLI